MRRTLLWLNGNACLVDCLVDCLASRGHTRKALLLFLVCYARSFIFLHHLSVLPLS